MMIDQSQNGQTIDLPVGQTLEVSLPENPTTGYRWAAASDGGPSCVVVSDQMRTVSGPPGRAGEHVWQLRAVGVGTFDFRLVHRRGFEPPQPGATSFVLHVRAVG